MTFARERMNLEYGILKGYLIIIIIIINNSRYDMPNIWIQIRYISQIRAIAS